MVIDTSCWFEEMPFEDDPYNNNKERNWQNTEPDTYNCGGYALNTFSWYLPYDEEYRENHNCGMWMESETQLVATTIRFTNFMLKEFFDLRLIDDLEDLNDNEYPIAFRLAEDDFHFCKRCDDGKWRHKRGRKDIEIIKEADVLFADDWCDKYDGPIVLFAKKLES